METPQSLAVVVPTYRSGLALWIGIGEVLRWRDPRIRLTQVVVVDDGSPGCGFREGTVRNGGVELVFLVNPTNRGQSEATWRGLGHVEADWALLLEDDLRAWVTVLDTVASRVASDVDLMSFARPGLESADTGQRAKAQPLVRKIFRWAGAGDLRDPTSPIKALRRAAFTPTALGSWRRSIHEGLVVLSRRTTECEGVPLVWEDRPSRYTPRRLVRVGVNIWPRLLVRALRRSSDRTTTS